MSISTCGGLAER